MRTTLDIADDVLQAAGDRARREKKTIGQVISDLARDALAAAPGAPAARALGALERARGIAASSSVPVRNARFSRRAAIAAVYCELATHV
jgi:hypothetical protein